MNAEPSTYTMIPFDLYKDIHKAIRVGLFEATAEAGRVDPSDRVARIALAARVHDLAEFLVDHARHEDTHIDPYLEQVLPDEAAAITASHVALEATMDQLKALAATVFDDTRDDGRAATHELYLELARFTSDYLAHQDEEERVVMPALLDALGIEVVLEIHGRILASIPPDQMATALGKMLPAINLDDRFEMLAGMRAEAPPEVFDGVLGLAADVLADHDLQALLARLDAAPAPSPV